MAINGGVTGAFHRRMSPGVSHRQAIVGCRPTDGAVTSCATCIPPHEMVELLNFQNTRLVHRRPAIIENDDSWGFSTISAGLCARGIPANVVGG
jgi:hypothetical protein